MEYREREKVVLYDRLSLGINSGHVQSQGDLLIGQLNIAGLMSSVT